MRLEIPAIPEQWIERLSYDGPAVVALALSGSLLAIADEDGGISVRSVGARHPSGEIQRWQPGFPISAIGMSESGSALFARSQDGYRLEVRGIDGESSLRLTPTVPNVPLAVGVFARLDRDDIFVASTEAMRLQAFHPTSGELLIDRRVSRPRGFAYRNFSAMGDRDSVIALGYYMDEGKDSLVKVSLSRLLKDDEEYLANTLYRPDLTDYAYRLAAGPSGAEQAVIYRDAEDDEEDDEDDSNGMDLHGFNGIYFRRLSDGAPGQRIPFTTAVTTGDPIFASGSFVALGTRTALQLVDRATGTTMSMPTGAIAFHPPTSRVVAWAAGKLFMVTVPD
jgi:hypothetical protein